MLKRLDVAPEGVFGDSGYIEPQLLGFGVHVGIDADVDPLFIAHTAHIVIPNMYIMCNYVFARSRVSVS